jgi:dipeptidyl aminopeptidase/acylaminoacyl peptidase
MRKFRQLGIRFPALAIATVSLWVLVWVDARGQDTVLSKEAYMLPPKVILDAVLAARPEDNVTFTNISPDGKKFLVTKNDGLPTLERMGRPHVHLGELPAFDHTANRSHQLYVKSNVGYDIFYYAQRRKVPVEVPSGARVSNAAWSPDGSMLAFYAHFLKATHIYIANAMNGKSRQLTDIPVLATMVTSFQWTRDGKQIETVMLPEDGTRVFKFNDVANEPKVRIAQEGKNPSRTYRYLLESPEDMKLLEHLTTGQIALIDVESGKVTKVGSPTMIRTLAMSPGGDQFRVGTMKKPFSYYVPATNFGSQDGIWNMEGKNLYTLAEKSLRDPSVQVAGGAPPAGGKGKGQGKGGGKKGKGAPATPAPQQPQQPVDPDNPQPDAQPPEDPEGKRDLGFRPDGMGMSYLQMEPADPKDEKAPRKDRVMQWLPPYGKSDVKAVYETPNRITGLQYSDDCKMLFLTQMVDNQRQISAVDLADGNKVYILQKGGAGAGDGEDAELESPYTPPPEDFPETGYDDEQQKKGAKGGGFGGKGGKGGGSNLMMRNNRGQANVVRISTEGDVYLASTDRADGAIYPRAYIEKINIKTAKKNRIFQGRGDILETIDAVDGDDIKVVFTSRQKKDIVPDSYMNDLATGKDEKLTNNVDHTPWHHKLDVQRFQVTRVDGFKFWVKVTTSPEDKGKRLPAMFWIYPKEYTDQAAYNGKGGGKGDGGGGKDGAGGGRFTSPAPRSMTLLTLLGYAVVEPDVPIVGPAGRMNDNYVPDLRNSLWAVIDDLDKKGVIDRDRLAVGGHSYGAFSTANTLAHTPFFKAGIAGDGNYNRTLTPMSFQTEKRHLWEARETYLEMSPLLWADRINGALLMYHGMEDANVGTNPINAEFMYMSLRGLGKPVSLYMYPYEGHGPILKETTLDQWARWVAWLDTYVMSPQKKK